MRVDWQQELEGYSLLEIRNALRKLRFTNSTFTLRSIAEYLPRRPTLETTRRLIDGLIESGLVVVEEEGRNGKPTHFMMTDTGISLRAASATKRFARARAEKAVAKLLETLDRINADPIFVHDVEWVAVYGSYIRGEPDLGDIDVAVGLKGRWTPGNPLKGKTERELRAEKFEKKYPPPASFYEKGWWRFWPEVYTMRLLRSDTTMHIIERRELELIGCPYRQIFPEIKNVRAKRGWSFKRGEVVLKTVAPSSATIAPTVC